MYSLRKYQGRAFSEVYKSWQEFTRSLVVMPTGSGKTIVFAYIAAEELKNSRRCLILAHRDELIQQASDKLHKAVDIQCSIEKADQTAYLSNNAQTTIGSVQTLMRQSRLDRFSPDHFDTIVVDEAHHALSDSYQRILNYFSGAKVVGVTASPDRGDRRNLGQYFEKLAFEYSLRQAISEGYLCKIAAQTIPLKIDLSNVRTTAGDFNDKDLGAALDPYLEQIADKMAETVLSRRCLVFLPLIKTSEKMTALLRNRGFKAGHVCGVSPDRKEILEAFAAGDITCLCNSQLVTEGYDCPPIDCVVCLRPTKIRSFFQQMIGRGTRIHPGKENLLILDFLWQTLKHDLCHPCNLIAETDEIAAKMEEIQESAGAAIDIEEVEELAKKEVLSNREKSLARALHQKRTRKGRFIDPEEFGLSVSDTDLSDYEPIFPWESKPASEGQINTLVKFGFNVDKIQDRGYASKLLNKVFARSKQNMASPKQINLLKRFRYEDPQGMSFKTAKTAIDEIANNGWRRPLTREPERLVF